MTPARRLRGLSFALVMAAGCSGDSGSSSDRPATTASTITTEAPDRSSTTSSPTATTDASAADLGAATQALQRLVDDYDAAVAEILRDPRVAADATSGPVRAYLSLFGSGSAFADGALRFWAEEGARGRFYRPGPRGQLTDSTVTAVSASTPDEVTFTVCALKSIEIVDGDGHLIESQGGRSAASAVAQRIDGVWRLRDLTQVSPTSCPAQAGA